MSPLFTVLRQDIADLEAELEQLLSQPGIVAPEKQGELMEQLRLLKLKASALTAR